MSHTEPDAELPLEELASRAGDGDQEALSALVQRQVVAIGDLYRFDRFVAPAELWEDLERRLPTLLAGGTMEG